MGLIGINLHAAAGPDCAELCDLLLTHFTLIFCKMFQFFTQNSESEDSFTPSVPEFDFDEVESNVRYLYFESHINLPCAVLNCKILMPGF